MCARQLRHRGGPDGTRVSNPSRTMPVLPAGERLVYVTHGHQFNTKTPPPLRQGDVLLHGHTHIPAWEPFGRENLYLNPGSVSIPKNDTAHGYMTLENGVLHGKR